MRIKRVEIIGFKSFCDRAVVQIGESITGVVGPNGCGKSNIVDAIRWCMGEQSAKHLRGKAMEDVIFAGSETRGPAPMAEVSLTFDDVGFSHETLELAKNDEQEAMLDSIPEDDAEETKGEWVDAEGNKIASPVEEVQELLEDKPPAFEFSQYTEVTITRRLYRDGISQYFINKTPCRLRDITDFFLGTGVGTKAYAIIEQGRIGQIVSARPQDRRAIIEEAAGITKFKAKKKAAERKLDQTRQNLMRVSDIVTELDKRMGTLRRQSQKAERYRKYKAEMRDIELWKASHRWLELAGEATLVGARLGEVRSGLESARVEYAVKDATVVAERAELVVEERRLVGVQHCIHELDNKIRLGDSKIGFELREADDLEARIAGARTEIDEVEAQRERGRLELATRSTELAALEAEVARESSEVQAREAATGEARQMLANAESLLEQTRGKIADARTTIATSQAQLEALAERRGEAAARLERVVGEVEQYASRNKELEREHRRVDGALAELRQTRLDLGSQNEGFASRKEQLGHQVARGEAEVETLRTELHRRRSRLVSLEEIQQRYEGFARGTRAVMQGAEAFADKVGLPLPADPIRGVVADVVRAPELLEVAVEAALGDRLGGVLVADAAVGVAAIGYLKQEGGGRSAFVPMGADPVGEDESHAVPEPLFDETRIESAALRSIATAFEGEGNPGRGDLSEPHVAYAATPAHGIEWEPDAGLRAEIAVALQRAAEARVAAAMDIAASLGADASVVALGAEQRARSLAADASFAGGTWLAEAEQLGAALAADPRFAVDAHAWLARAENASVDVSVAPIEEFAGTAGDVVCDPVSVDSELAAIGIALRARSLAAEALLADPLAAGIAADAELFDTGAALRARSLAADAQLADPLTAGLAADAELFDGGAALRVRSRAADALADRFADAGGPVAGRVLEGVLTNAVADALARALRLADPWIDPLLETLHPDAQLANLGARLRMQALATDAVLADSQNGAQLADAQLVDQMIEAARPAAAPPRRKPAFEFEDRTQLVDAIVGAHAEGRDEVAVGEGVLGRMTDLVGFIAGFEQVGRRLLGRTVVVDHLERALDLHQRGVADRLVTLDGDVVDADGVVAGGSREAQGAGVLAQKREIRDLHEIVGRLEHDLSEAMQRLITAKAELSQVTKAIEGLRKQVHEGEVAIVGHEKDDARVRGELERHRDRLGQLANEQLELESRLAAIGADESTHRERLERGGTELRELEQRQLDVISELAAHRDRLEELARLLTEARIRAAQLEAQRAAVEAATLRLMQTDGELAARAQRLAAECEEAARRAAALREGCERLAAELAATREEREAESRTLEEGRTAYQARVDALSEIELAARELRTRADALGNELNQLELRHGQIGMTRQVVEDQVSERYQVDLPAALHDYHQRPQVSEVEDNRLTELRELIERMGTDINLTAIEEFADVSKRFEFLSAQKIDLERAVDQLQRAIDKINKTSRKLFKDTFAAVNATFKEVFPRLFRGGHAALSLSLPTPPAAGDGEAPAKARGGDDDLLEAGIEIMAQPPGKKNVTVDQLSGGEKALTAVALVFSIFLIKPSPFCILDEVDAPLDEANVDRYNEIVREMTDRSQFIVITHNKRTMEAADNLYGVTMQEPGVSKLVNVNLSKLGPADRPAKRSESTVRV